MKNITRFVVAIVGSLLLSHPANAQAVFSNSTSITIADNAAASPYPSDIVVSGVSAGVRRVTVQLDGVTHTFPEDIDIALVAPNGQCAMLMSDVGGNVPISGISLNFDDAAATMLPDSAQIVAGTYKPTNFGSSDGFVPPGPDATTCSQTLGQLVGQNPNGTWKLFVVDDESSDVGSISGGWTLTFTTQRLRTDVDGDGLSDLTVWRGSNGGWYTKLSSGTSSSLQWGTASQGDIPLAMDIDGDGKMDPAVYRPSSGGWYILKSSTGYSSWFTAKWGVSTDIPVVADFDGDGKSDLAVFRPATGGWYILYSGTNYTTSLAVAFGTNGDVPVPRDYDGDGLADIAVWRPSNGTWYVRQSSTGVPAITTWGTAGDIPVPDDYDGDGLADIAVWRPSTGVWWIRNSGTGTVTHISWGSGSMNDVPVPGDYDGDGKTDLAVWRPANGVWYIRRSSNGSYFTSAWGISSDIPISER